MGLFKPKSVNEGIKALFGRSTRREDLEGETKPVTSNDDVKTTDTTAKEDVEETPAQVKPLQDKAHNEESEIQTNDDQKRQKKSKRDENEDLEEEYFRSMVSAPATAKDDNAKSAKVNEKDNEKVTSDKKAKAQTEQSERTPREVFVGNVPNDVITDKAAYAKFKKLFKDAVTQDENKNKKEQKKDTEAEAEAESDEDDGTSGDKVIESIRFRSIAFSELLPRRAAFIKRKLNPTRDAVNAYIVFGSEKHAKAALKLNATLFMEHHLRVDSVANPASVDGKCSVFIGNLDFEATEESLWRHFESCGPVDSVRVIRDAKTNFGKGFAYVKFVSPPAVELALLMNGKELGGRKLRVARAKHTAKKSHLASKGSQPLKSRPAPKERRHPREDSKDGKRAHNAGKPREPRKEVLEGARAQEGQGTKLGRGLKRKARHTDSARAKRRAANRAAAPKEAKE